MDGGLCRLVELRRLRSLCGALCPTAVYHVARIERKNRHNLEKLDNGKIRKLNSFEKVGASVFAFLSLL